MTKSDFSKEKWSFNDQVILEDGVSCVVVALHFGKKTLKVLHPEETLPKWVECTDIKAHIHASGGFVDGQSAKSMEVINKVLDDPAETLAEYVRVLGETMERNRQLEGDVLKMSKRMTEAIKVLSGK